MKVSVSCRPVEGDAVQLMAFPLLWVWVLKSRFRCEAVALYSSLIPSPTLLRENKKCKWGDKSTNWSSTMGKSSLEDDQFSWVIITSDQVTEGLGQSFTKSISCQQLIQHIVSLQVKIVFELSLYTAQSIRLPVSTQSITVQPPWRYVLLY